jgi:hypothetical protein
MGSANGKPKLKKSDHYIGDEKRDDFPQGTPKSATDLHPDGDLSCWGTHQPVHDMFPS